MLCNRWSEEKLQIYHRNFLKNLYNALACSSRKFPTHLQEWRGRVTSPSSLLRKLCNMLVMRAGMNIKYDVKSVLLQQTSKAITRALNESFATAIFCAFHAPSCWLASRPLKSIKLFPVLWTFKCGSSAWSPALGETLSKVAGDCVESRSRREEIYKHVARNLNIERRKSSEIYLQFRSGALTRTRKLIN